VEAAADFDDSYGNCLQLYEQNKCVPYKLQYQRQAGGHNASMRFLSVKKTATLPE